MGFGGGLMFLINKNRNGGFYMNYHKYSTLSDAAKIAVTRCGQWRFATSDEFYDSANLQSIAQIHDAESCTDEDSFYIVSPEGAIGFSEDGENIDWLFISLNITEDLPLSFSTKPEGKFCRKCGKPVKLGAHFCGSCGAKLH